MTYNIKRSKAAIDGQLNQASAWADAGGSAMRGMTYENGVEAAIQWMLGEVDDLPIEEGPPDTEGGEAEDGDDDGA
jgi:hypothetical protein